ncbi:MAG: transcriptional regulator [Actinomycetota bacterium]
MTTPFERLADVDQTIHAPARLAILTALSVCEQADFTYLKRITGLTQGNLGSHLGKLEEAALVEIEKSFAGRTSRTSVRLLPAGRDAITGWWAAMEEARAATAAWSPDDDG